MKFGPDFTNHAGAVKPNAHDGRNYLNAVAESVYGEWMSIDLIIWTVIIPTFILGWLYKKRTSERKWSLLFYFFQNVLQDFELRRKLSLIRFPLAS